MPLKETELSNECPLEKFKIDIAYPGRYTADPVEKCSRCNFGNLEVSMEDMDKVCMSPSDMTWEIYDSLREQYSLTKEKQNRKGFWKFVEENHEKAPVT